jgi:pyruvate dehydrogenase E1 component alpha subunit
VCLCFFGDGGANQGTFHESGNIAAAYTLPCIYICENNMYAGGIKQYYDGVFKNEGMDYPRKVKDIADRARGYDIPGEVVDGNDVEAVYEAVAKAVEYARKGNGPTLIECKTYRWRTHFEVEPDTYRDPKEVAEWKARCPIKTYGEKLKKAGVLTQDDLNIIAGEVTKEMDDAVKFALESPEPEAAEALRDVYAE